MLRTSKTYARLAGLHHHLETSHKNGRSRYGVGAHHYLLRPRRIGIDVQCLRGAMAVFLEWARILLRNGWLTGRAQRRTSDGPEARLHDYGFHQQLLDQRHEAGLDTVCERFTDDYRTAERRNRAGLPPPEPDG